MDPDVVPSIGVNPVTPSPRSLTEPQAFVGDYELSGTASVELPSE